MSDLFADVMSASAAASASEAADQARGARAASEERLESSGKNPFISFEQRELDYPTPGWFSKGPSQLSAVKGRVSIKRTDIAYLSETTDDFGNTYTVVYLEERCNLDTDRLFVGGSMESVQTYINNQ